MTIIRKDSPTEWKPRRVMCPKCKRPMRLRRTQKYRYPDGTLRWFYYCPNWPECTVSVSAHPNGEPMGDPGDERTKAARVVLHTMFDPLWQVGEVTRDEAYQWLASVTGLAIEECHIGKFNEPMCLTVIHIIRSLMKEETHAHRPQRGPRPGEQRWRSRLGRATRAIRTHAPRED